MEFIFIVVISGSVDVEMVCDVMVSCCRKRSAWITRTRMFPILDIAASRVGPDGEIGAELKFLDLSTTGWEK